MSISNPGVLVVRQSKKMLALTAADPTATGASDLVDQAGNPLADTHFTIRTGLIDCFYFIPMAIAAEPYRSCVIGLKNHGTDDWDKTPQVRLYGAYYATVAGCIALLAEYQASVTKAYSVALGAGGMGVGGVGLATPVTTPTTWCQVDAMLAGWNYLGLRITFSEAPTTGALAYLWVTRMPF
jgi:hypothetical protein